MFKYGRADIHDEERSALPSFLSDLVQSFDQNCVKEENSQFQNFRVSFHKFHAPFSKRLSELG
jgi:hypothetical protein